MTALGIFPSALFSQSADRNFCLHLFFRCYSSASRGLKSTFSRVNNIFRTLILFFRVVPELLRRLSSQCCPLFHLVSDHSQEENRLFFTSFPLPQNLFNVAPIWMWCFLPESDSMNILISVFICTFKVTYDNIIIILKKYSYLLTT